MNTKIFVGNLAYSTSEQELRDCFAQFGNILEVKIPVDRETGRSRGFAFIQFEDASAASNAVSFNETKELNGRKISVSIARETQSRGGNSGGRGDRDRGGRGGNSRKY